jgi:hypothetical protein
LGRTLLGEASSPTRTHNLNREQLPSLSSETVELSYFDIRAPA